MTSAMQDRVVATVEPTPAAPAWTGVLTASAWREQRENTPLRIRVTYTVDRLGSAAADRSRSVVVDNWQEFMVIAGRWYTEIANPDDVT